MQNLWRSCILVLLLVCPLISCANLDCEYDTEEQPNTKPSGKYYCCDLKSFAGFADYNSSKDDDNDKDQNALVTMVRVGYPVVMKKIHKKMFDNFDKLEYLMIYATDLQDISEADFEEAEDLAYLRIHTNAIRELHDNIFKHAKNLRYINLSYNKIEIVHKDTFEGLDKLSEIHLNNNRLSKIHSKAFSNMPQLSVINMKNNLCIKEKFEKDLQSLKSNEEREKKDVELETLLVKRKCHKNYMEDAVTRSAGDILMPTLLTFTTLAIL